MTSDAPLAAIFGCREMRLDPDEKRFFKDTNPLGFILFQRNCDNPDQVRALVDELRDCVGRADAPVLIDQEGGRVQRLKPPHWRDAPSAARFAELAASDPERARQAARLNARLIAWELNDLGITVDCAPVLDVPQAGADAVIGDRAYGSDPAMITALATAVCEGLLEGGVSPVIKHIPGHGRADVDSHLALPVVSTAKDELRTIDFVPFAELAHMPWAMTAHVVYTDMDGDNPATTSAKVIDVIRREIGFTGVLVTDDLSMKALKGGLAERVRDALAAGCDLALHCNGQMDEMMEIAEACSPLNATAHDKIAEAEKSRLENILPRQETTQEAIRRLTAMLQGEG